MRCGRGRVHTGDGPVVQGEGAQGHSRAQEKEGQDQALVKQLPGYRAQMGRAGREEDAARDDLQHGQAPRAVATAQGADKEHVRGRAGHGQEFQGIAQERGRGLDRGLAGQTQDRDSGQGQGQSSGRGEAHGFLENQPGPDADQKRDRGRDDPGLGRGGQAQGRGFEPKIEAGLEQDRGQEELPVAGPVPVETHGAGQGQDAEQGDDHAQPHHGPGREHVQGGAHGRKRPAPEDDRPEHGQTGVELGGIGMRESGLHAKSPCRKAGWWRLAY